MNINVNEKLWQPISEVTQENTREWHDGDEVTLALQCLGFDESLFNRLIPIPRINLATRPNFERTDFEWRRLAL